MLLDHDDYERVSDVYLAVGQSWVTHARATSPLAFKEHDNEHCIDITCSNVYFYALGLPVMSKFMLFCLDTIRWN